MPPIKSSGSNASASRLGIREKSQQKKKNISPRSPLKVRDLNAPSSCSSSSSSVITATSVSSEAPRGCLGFLLSQNHSSSSTVVKNGCNRPKSNVGKTPRSAPNLKNLRGKLSDESQNMKKSSNLRNPEKPSSRRVDRLKKKPPTNSRSGVCGKILSGFELKLSDNAGNFTPVTKLGTGSGVDSFGGHNKGLKMGEEDTNCSDPISPIPPIQASVSPEVQGGSTSLVIATPNTCYGAGHVLSGVTDKRKCRARGILTIGDNDLFGSSKTKLSGNENEKLGMALNNRRVTFVPSPTEASIHWLLSPCDEKRDEAMKDDGARCELGLARGEFSVPFGCSSSPSSSLGFSSELFNKSNSTITTSDATTTDSSRRSMSCVLSPESTSNFQGLLGPSFDHLVCSPSPTSLSSAPICEVGDSPERGKNWYGQIREVTPVSEDSMGSGNVIRTPISNSKSPNFGTDLSRDEISRLWFECELESVGEALGGVSLSPESPTVDSFKMSFEFNPPIDHTSSIDFAFAREDIDTQAPLRVPKSLEHDLPESVIRTSLRDGLASHVSEIEESDYCRCFSDEEDANNRVDPYDSRISPELDAIDSNKIDAYTCDPHLDSSA